MASRIHLRIHPCYSAHSPLRPLQAAIPFKECLVEHTQLAYHSLNVLLRRQKGCAEVQAACRLPKAAARHYNNASGLQQLTAVQPVARLAQRLSCCYSLCRQRYPASGKQKEQKQDKY